MLLLTGHYANIMWQIVAPCEFA